MSFLRITSPVYFMPGVEASTETEIGTGRLFCVTISAGGTSLISESSGLAVAGDASVAEGAVDVEGVADTGGVAGAGGGAGGSTGTLGGLDFSGVSIRSHMFVS